MGAMRFLIHPPELLEGWDAVYRAYVSGADGRVFPTRVEIDGNVMACRRNNSESGKLHVSWPIEGFGQPVVNTTSLPEREEPYVLAVELARGKISQIREQLGVWELAGMTVPEGFLPLHHQAYRLFSESIGIQERPDEASAVARQALVLACQAAEALSLAYTKQRLNVRRQHSLQLPASLGCNLGHAVPDSGWSEAFGNAFNAAAVPIEWRIIEPVEGEYDWEMNDAQVDWCQQHKLLMYGGPLLDLSPQGLPNWLWQWEQDFQNLQSFVCDFVETAISRYVGKIRNWEISARVNTGGALALNEDNRLTLVARTLEVARQVDEKIQLMICIDQPWGDYQARGQHRLSPLQFVDALVRSGIGLSGVNLEIGVGYRPRGSASRGLLDFSQLIDQWSNLGIPLHVTLAFPSASGADPQSKSDLEVDVGHWKHDWSESAQADWIDLYLPLLMAKESVVGIYWAHFTDQKPHDFPHAGLLRADGAAKPILERFLKYRRTYWQPDHDEDAS